MADFLFDKERLAKLEREMAELKEAVRAMGTALAITLEETLDQLVDDHTITRATRNEIVRRAQEKCPMVSAKSMFMGQVLHKALSTIATPFTPKVP